MYGITSVRELICFIVPLVKDYDYELESDSDAVKFLTNGGCYELAKVINYYFPDTEFVVKNDFSHVAILSDGKIYDAYDYYEEWQVEKYGIDEKLYRKNPEDFKVYTKEEIDSFPVEYGNDSFINGLTVENFVKKYIEDLGNLKVGPVSKLKK